MIQVRRIENSDRKWVETALRTAFGSKRMARLGQLYEPATHEGFLAVVGAAPLAFITYLVEGDQLEITAIASQREGRGAGGMLISAAIEKARNSGCRRVWVITTNDNLAALRFYQKRGFELVRVHRGAVDASRATLKPEIPRLGQHGIPLRDELELEVIP